MNPETYRAMRQEYDLTSDNDQWGTCMNWLFTISAYLTFETDLECPDDWEYRPSPLGSDNDEDDYTYQIIKSEFSPDDVLSFGCVLFRYSRALERAGLSY